MLYVVMLIHREMYESDVTVVHGVFDTELNARQYISMNIGKQYEYSNVSGTFCIGQFELNKGLDNVA